MALSGTLFTNVGAGWRLQLEWEATQNISANTSTITARLYWMSLGSQYTVNSSATKTGNIKIDGNTSSFSGAGLANLTGNQKKLLHTYTRTVTHNPDGTRTVPLQGNFSLNVSLSGVYYGTVTVSGNAVLDKIPRHSTLTSSPNWTAGNNLIISINRAFSTMTHTVNIYVDNVLIRQLTNVGTSATVNFTEDENQTIFDLIGSSTGKPSKIEVLTYNAGEYMGMNTYNGTCSAPNASTVASSADFNIGDPVQINLNVAMSAFYHDIRVYTNDILIKTFNNIVDSVTWIPTSTEIEDMYNSTPNANSAISKIEVDTYYKDTQIRSTTTKTGVATVTNSNPQFDGNFVYADTNPTTTVVTGDDQYIVQNKSTVVVTIPITESALGINGATMTSYIATLGGSTIVQPYSYTEDVTFDFGTIDATTDLILTIRAIDSRGNYTERTKTVKILPYNKPTVTTSAKRANNFETSTTIKLSGSYSPLTINGINKNIIQDCEYRYKEVTSSSWSDWESFSGFTTSGNTYTAVGETISLDSDKAWDIEVRVTDLFDFATGSNRVAVGVPNMFIDTQKKSIGINKFPQYDWVDIDAVGDISSRGTLHSGSNQFLSDGTAGLALYNSDVYGTNGLWFYNTANTSDRGIFFPKSTAPAGTMNIADCDNFKIIDGRMYLNGQPLGTSDSHIIWSGAVILNASNVVIPNKTIDQCEHGWVLVWGDFDPGTPGTVNDYDWATSVIPKELVNLHEGSIHYWIIPSNVTSTIMTHTIKQGFVYKGRITGHNSNASATINGNDVLLRYVIEY